MTKTVIDITKQEITEILDIPIRISFAPQSINKAQPEIETISPRLFKIIVSPEIVDLDDDLITIDAIEEALEIWFKRGAPILDHHQNLPCGYGNSYKRIVFEGFPAIELVGEIFSGDKALSNDNEVWEKIQNGIYEGNSIGGRFLMAVTVVMDKKRVRKITKAEIYEISMVIKGANPLALIIEKAHPVTKKFNKLYKLITQMVSNMSDEEKKNEIVEKAEPDKKPPKEDPKKPAEDKPEAAEVEKPNANLPDKKKVSPDEEDKPEEDKPNGKKPEESEEEKPEDKKKEEARPVITETPSESEPEVAKAEGSTLDEVMVVEDEEFQAMKTAIATLQEENVNLKKTLEENTKRFDDFQSAFTKGLESIETLVKSAKNPKKVAIRTKAKTEDIKPITEPTDAKKSDLVSTGRAVQEDIPATPATTIETAKKVANPINDDYWKELNNMNLTADQRSAYLQKTIQQINPKAY